MPPNDKALPGGDTGGRMRRTCNTHTGGAPMQPPKHDARSPTTSGPSPRTIREDCHEGISERPPASSHMRVNMSAPERPPKGTRGTPAASTAPKSTRGRRSRRLGLGLEHRLGDRIREDAGDGNGRANDAARRRAGAYRAEAAKRPAVVDEPAMRANRRAPRGTRTRSSGRRRC
eukprot:6979197-Prymnesium_polylepis.3